ncbi:peptidylprolyl isomerase [Mycobacterium frederiksbergense]|uniref:Peptidyl-prolyl cis-trans isomerase n=1 Tax=Mycolicibacterium frederiksbergense TaxID=117567 RepID=A0A6H0SE76_9MYCO|nr:peptidylprolyl isomerase [Mycolicibacterium frederiksbergense]MCV7047940.1 peptidylprolyl isomerase [Mycolicibacterium frederiksbergense]QIV84871.1 peptidylprolyl isomerase [Mycolicibacterium frederiksbergense]
MPTNEQRRAAAKRKLERQLERREQRAKRQRLITIIASVTGVLVVVGAVVATVVITSKDSPETTSASTTTSLDPTAPQPASDGTLPPFVAPAGLGQDCQYPAAGEASRKVDPPRTGKIPMDEAEISVSMATDQGNIGLMLNNAQAPCTSNSFASLAGQGYFNDTPCHRLTTSDSLSVLQCGDPTGQGTGGPGYEFANEYPTNQYQPDNPALQQPVLYPRGTLAMANAGAGTNGSQFFLVYKDSQLPPNYTVFGTIDETGLATLDKIAGAGVEGGGQDGPPATKVQVKTIQLD